MGFWSESKKSYPRKGKNAKPIPKKELVFRKKERI